MKIGIISDTHSFLDRSVFDHFAACDEIWHAGDIGNLETLELLESFKNVQAVWGNIDGHEVRSATKEFLIFEREQKKILIIHIAAKPPRYNAQVRSLISKHHPDILVCGHSHMLKIEKDQENKLLFINPGAAGIQGFHRTKTLVRFHINEGVLSQMEVIDLGKRGKVT